MRRASSRFLARLQAIACSCLEAEQTTTALMASHGNDFVLDLRGYDVVELQFQDAVLDEANGAKPPD